jgi:hypothetical protein
MGGLPVFLVSVSFRPENKVIPTGSWRRGQRLHADKLIDQALAGLGDGAFERSFRMCSTLCRHRVLTKAERARLPEGFARSARDEAGTPVELLWSRGVPPELDAGRACLEGRMVPARLPMGMSSRPSIKGGGGVLVPDPCERCSACVANQEARERIQQVMRETPGVDLLGTR